MSESAPTIADEIREFIDSARSWNIPNRVRDGIRDKAVALLDAPEGTPEEELRTSLNSLKIQSKGGVPARLERAEAMNGKACTTANGRPGIVEGITINGRVKVRYTDGQTPRTTTNHPSTVTVKEN